MFGFSVLIRHRSPVIFLKPSSDLCFQLQFGATLLALSTNFGMKLNLPAYLRSECLYIMLKLCKRNSLILN